MLRRQAGSWEASFSKVRGVVGDWRSSWLGLSHVEGQLPGALRSIVGGGVWGGEGDGCCPLASHCHLFCGGYQLWICDCGTDRGDIPLSTPSTVG